MKNNNFIKQIYGINDHGLIIIYSTEKNSYNKFNWSLKKMYFKINSESARPMMTNLRSLTTSNQES